VTNLNKIKLISTYLTIVIIIFSTNLVIFVKADESKIIPPEYSWQSQENSWEELSEEEKKDVSRETYYLIKMEKLSIHYPTQNIDIDFMYRKTANYHENDDFLWIGEQFDIVVWYYDKNGNYFASYIRIPDFSYGEHSNLSYSDVFFEDNGETLCWNCSYDGIFLNNVNENNTETNLILYSIDYKFKIKNYDNTSLLIETDTYLKFKYLKENFNKPGVKISNKMNISVAYLYILLDVFNGFKRVKPEIDEEKSQGWYKIGDYDVSTIITADKAILSFNNGTKAIIDIDKNMRVEREENTPSDDDPNMGVYTLFNATFKNIPFNNSKGNITSIYYDPVIFEYYETRFTFLFALILIPSSLIIMVIIAKKKKLEYETKGGKLDEGRE